MVNQHHEQILYEVIVPVVERSRVEAVWHALAVACLNVIMTGYNSTNSFKQTEHGHRVTFALRMFHSCFSARSHASTFKKLRLSYFQTQAVAPATVVFLPT